MKVLTVDAGPEEVPGEVVDGSDQLRADVAKVDGGAPPGSATPLAELLEEPQLRRPRLEVPPDVGLEQPPGEGAQDRLHLLLALHDAEGGRGRARAVVRRPVAVQGAKRSSRRVSAAPAGAAVLTALAVAALEGHAE